MASADRSRTTGRTAALQRADQTANTTNLPIEVVNGRGAVYESAHKQAVDQVFSAAKGRLVTDYESGDNLAVDQVFAQDLFDVVGRV